MYDLAEILLDAQNDRIRFRDLMREIAKDFTAGEVGEAQFYDRMREATDLLPMTKRTALHFSEKIHKILTGNQEKQKSNPSDA